jgi:hypothetical protein
MVSLKSCEGVDGDPNLVYFVKIFQIEVGFRIADIGEDVDILWEQLSYLLSDNSSHSDVFNATHRTPGLRVLVRLDLYTLEALK